MIRPYESKLEVKQGRYGSSKVKIFTILSSYTWLNTRQLCLASGITYHSLARTLSRWVNFGYIKKRPIEIHGHYEYALLPKGKTWLSLASRYLPNYQVFIRQLNAWQAIMTDDVIEDFMIMPFNDFVASLNERIIDLKNNGKRA